jgi:hypothetical protein
VVGLVLCGFSLDPEREAGSGTLAGPPLVAAVASLLVAAAACYVAARRSARWTEAGLSCATGLLYASTGVITKALALWTTSPGPLWVAAALLAPLIGLSLLALAVLQMAHHGTRAVVLLALISVLSGFLPAGLGLVVFDEGWPDAPRAALRLVSFATLLAGVFLLARRSPVRA